MAMELGPERVFRAGVEYSLSSNMPQNAVFMGERLCAMLPSESNLRMLAESYLRAGRPSQAKAVLEDCTEPHSRYLYGVVCIDLNLLREAEAALRPVGLTDYAQEAELRDDEFPGQAAGMYHLGVVLQRTARKEAARLMYRRALRMNPFLWVALEALTTLGGAPDTYGADAMTDAMTDADGLDLLSRQSQYFAPAKPPAAGPERAGDHPLPQTPASDKRPRAWAPSREGFAQEDAFVTPRAVRETGRLAPSRGSSVARRSGRMSLNSSPSPKQAIESESRDVRRTPMESPDVDAPQTCSTILQQLGRGLLALSEYRCADAIAALRSLPDEHQNTGLVLSLLGRAYMEIGDYQAAADMFEDARATDPGRLDGLLEYFSTVLWHQKREFELADLARQAIAQDRFSAATWCAAGNCCSLQQDPTNALKFFKRAAQVDPWSAYARTLIGHEHVAKEDLPAALASYREAINIDPRHANAWYGLGHVFQKQEKYRVAERYYREALRLNPQSATLHYHLGCALSQAGRRDEALEALGRALTINPSNPVAKFERAKVLRTEGRYDAAMSQLQEICESFPTEAAVHYELGHLYRETGDLDGALKSFGIAVNLDPKARGYKRALDSLGELE